MPRAFICPHCGLQTEVDDQYVGQRGPCVGCGKTIVIGSTESNQESDSSGKETNQTTPIVVGLLAAMLLSLLLGVAILLTVVMSNRRSNQWLGRSAICETNLRRIGLALAQYHDAHGRYPPAYTTDADGKPMHSWRVLLLPYLGEETLYGQYDFSQPWDSPTNLRLVGQMPDVFVCPDDGIPTRGETSYMFVVGRGTLFDGDKQMSARSISDGAANTILVVESTGGAVNWTEPVDLDVRQLALGVNARKKGGIRSAHATGGASALMADGTVKQLRDHLRPDILRAFVTPNGGEQIGTDVLDSRP